jgi:hypothetical protein
MRLNSVRRLSTIALALGEERTRTELIPFLKGELLYRTCFLQGQQPDLHPWPLISSSYPFARTMLALSRGLWKQTRALIMTVFFSLMPCSRRLA